MRREFALQGMADANKAIAAELRGRSRKAVEIGGEGLKEDLRRMTGAALGDRLAKTWQMKLYGADGSESAAAFIWTKAPRIIAGNMSGGTSVPINGSRYLAIPSDRVPRRFGGRGAKSRMSPEEVEAFYNQDLILRRGKRAGTLLGFVSNTRRGARKPGPLVLMFTFVRSVRRTKKIDPAAAFARWGARTRRMLQQGV